MHNAIAVRILGASAAKPKFPAGLEMFFVLFFFLFALPAYRLWRGQQAFPWNKPQNSLANRFSVALLPGAVFFGSFALAVGLLGIASSHGSNTVRVLFTVFAFVCFFIAAASFVAMQTLLYKGKPSRLLPPPYREQVDEPPPSL
jgi:hypothetical protein